MEKTVNAIAALVGGTVHGDGTRMIRGLASLDEAGVNDLAFAVPPHNRQPENPAQTILHTDG